MRVYTGLSRKFVLKKFILKTSHSIEVCGSFGTDVDSCVYFKLHVSFLNLAIKFYLIYQCCFRHFSTFINNNKKKVSINKKSEGKKN